MTDPPPERAPETFEDFVDRQGQEPPTVGPGQEGWHAEHRTLAPTELEWRVQGSTDVWSVKVSWLMIDGRPEPAGFSAWKSCREGDDGHLHPLGDAGPERIRAAELRALPFARIVSRAREIEAEAGERSRAEATYWAQRLQQTLEGDPNPRPLSRIDEEGLNQAYFSAVESDSRLFDAKAGGRYPASYWKQVAALYRKAWGKGWNPTKFVQQELHLPYSTASKHVARAREEGALPATSQGRPAAVKHPASTSRRRKGR